MKIVLPKTLAEPGTIPWPTLLSDSELATVIKWQIEDYFAYLEREKITPAKAKKGSLISCHEIISALRHRALNTGAETVFSEVWKLKQGVGDTKNIGHRYLINYTVPEDKRVYRLVLDSYFE